MDKKEVLKMIIPKCWYFFWGRIIATFLYDRNVLKTKYYQGKFLGMAKRGWEWTVADFKARLLLGVNRGVKFPISFGNSIINKENLIFDYDDLEIFRGYGKFFQANGGKIIIGKGTWIANNVGIITANHNRDDLNTLTDNSDVIIGKNCWIGMNSVILPGTILGDNITVGAGSVVKGDYSEGYCLLAGAPAVVKKKYENKNDK